MERSDCRVGLHAVPESEVNVGAEALGDVDAVSYTSVEPLVVGSFVEGVGALVTHGGTGLDGLVAIGNGHIVAVGAGEILDDG